jgi:hypothetical protein
MSDLRCGAVNFYEPSLGMRRFASARLEIKKSQTAFGSILVASRNAQPMTFFMPASFFVVT